MPNVLRSSSVRGSYERLKPIADRLKADFDQSMERRPSDWHFTSRVKSPDSYLEKLQTGRVPNQESMEDFFAATVVVPNRSDIPAAISYVERLMSIEYRKPPGTPTRARPSDFQFDDIRLYGTLRVDESLPAGPIHRMLFEVQVKTFLQHAWAVATHDTIYKSSKVSWQRSRLAYEIRALLEHAESAIDLVDAYDADTTNARVGVFELLVSSMIEFITENWPPEIRPDSLVRAAENIVALCDDLGEPPAALIAAMEAALPPEGPPYGWSPYDFALHTASIEYPQSLKAILIRRPMKRSRVYYVDDAVLTRLGLLRPDAPSSRA